MAEYTLDGHHVILLTKACESLDRIEEAREIIKKEGLIYKDRFGSPRANPAVAIERDNKTAVARLFRELGLDLAGDGKTALRFACKSQLTRMPVRKRALSRRQALDSNAQAWLRGDESCGFFRFKSQEDLAALWEAYGDDENYFWRSRYCLPITVEELGEHEDAWLNSGDDDEYGFNSFFIYQHYSDEEKQALWNERGEKSASIGVRA